MIYRLDLRLSYVVGNVCLFEAEQLGAAAEQLAAPSKCDIVQQPCEPHSRSFTS